MIRRGLGVIALGVAITALVLAAAFGYLAAAVVTLPALARDLGAVGAFAVFCLGVPVTFAFAVAAHEAGHFVVGAGLGFGPRVVVVGPVVWTREPGGWRLGFDRRSWIGGRVVTDRVGGRWGMALFLLAGPAANALTGLLAAGLAFGDLPAVVRCLAGLYAVGALFFGLVNLLPLREWDLDSDGLALTRLWVRNAQPWI